MHRFVDVRWCLGKNVTLWIVAHTVLMEVHNLSDRVLMARANKGLMPIDFGRFGSVSDECIFDASLRPLKVNHFYLKATTLPVRLGFLCVPSETIPLEILPSVNVLEHLGADGLARYLTDTLLVLMKRMVDNKLKLFAQSFQRITPSKMLMVAMLSPDRVSAIDWFGSLRFLNCHATSCNIA